VCARGRSSRWPFAVDYGEGDIVLEDHLLLGMMRVPDSVAGRVLAEHGVTLEAAEASWSAPGDIL
jgi:Clp amino terminal domain, pathogenicity island component